MKRVEMHFSRRVRPRELCKGVNEATLRVDTTDKTRIADVLITRSSASRLPPTRAGRS
jgi:hypothetical protein